MNGALPAEFEKRNRESEAKIKSLEKRLEQLERAFNSK